MFLRKWSLFASTVTFITLGQELMRATSQHDVILPVEGNLGEVVLLAMVLTCCVVDCHRRGGQENVSFYRIPSATDPRESKDRLELLCRRRELWINRIGRKDWNPSKYSRVCSDHFISVIFMINIQAQTFYCMI